MTSVIDAKFEPYTRYYYRVRAFNAYGVSEYTTVRGFQTGAPVPAAPSGLKATAVSSSQVELSWIDNSSDEVSFAVERSTDGVAFSVVRSLAQNNVTTSDILLQPGTTYHYRVRAANGSGSSDPSNVVSVRTVDVAPRAPLNVLVEAVSSGEVRVRWTDNSANEDGFRIERSTDGANYTQVGTVGRDVLLFVDPTTVPLTGYYYRVSAYNGIGASSYTVATRVTTPDAPPAAPSGLAGAVISDRQVNLTWRDNSANETGFRIERSAGGQFIEVGTTGANVQSFEDRGTSATTTYGYRVRAVNGGGESAYSNVAMVTTPVPLPLAPVGLTATNNRKKTAAVSWQPVEDPPASRYELLRETYKKKTWAYPAVVATVTAGGSLSVIDASGKGTFRYSVRACNEGGCSAYSAPVQVVVTK